MKVFLTGATGYVGSAVLEALLRAGHHVVATAREPEKVAQLTSKGVTAILGELGTAKSYLDAAAGCDAVVHTAFESSPRGIEKDRLALDTLLPALVRHASGAPRAFVYTTGVWVLGKTYGTADETAPLNPAPHVAWRPAHEQIVLDAATNGLLTMVVRPGILYGGTRGIVSDLLKDALNGLVRVIGPGKNCWPCVYDRDLAELYVRLVQTPDASGVYHANDEADERVNDIVDAIAEHVPMKPDIRRVPMPEAKKKLGTYAEALALDQRVRSPRARALGWAPTLHSVGGNVPRLLEEFRARRR